MKKDYHDVNDGLINLSEMSFEVSNNQKKFLERVDKVCKSLRINEEKSYLRGSINEKLIPEFSKIGMLGCPISKIFGGLGYDILTYLLALERIGQEGSSIRTFFSCHTSIGQLILQMWSNNEQKRRYLPNTKGGHYAGKGCFNCMRWRDNIRRVTLQLYSTSDIKIVCHRVTESAEIPFCFSL